jgi:hypothetical protein
MLLRPLTVEVPLMSTAGVMFNGSPTFVGGIKVATAPVVGLSKVT